MLRQEFSAALDQEVILKMAKAKAPVKKVPNGLKLTLEGSPLEVKVAFAAITPKGLQYGGSLASW